MYSRMVRKHMISLPIIWRPFPQRLVTHGFYFVGKNMGLNGYIVHNNFVYKSSSPQILTYTIILLVLAYVFYAKIWPTIRRLLMCFLRTAVNELLIQYDHENECLLQAYVIVNSLRVWRKRSPLVTRFRKRLKQTLNRRLRARKLLQIRNWHPEPSPLLKSPAAWNTTRYFSTLSIRPHLWQEASPSLPCSTHLTTGCRQPSVCFCLSFCKWCHSWGKQHSEQGALTAARLSGAWLPTRLWERVNLTTYATRHRKTFAMRTKTMKMKCVRVWCRGGWWERRDIRPAPYRTRRT